MFDNIILEPEQKELLAILVESARNLPRNRREKFYIMPLAYFETQVILTHPGFPTGKIEAYPGDIEVLASLGFLSISHEQSIKSFNINPIGYAYYQYWKQQNQQPLEKITGDIKTYVESDIFREKYPIAYQKWLDAENILWATDSEQQLTTIGHLCREAIQEFADVLVNHYQSPNIDENKTHDQNRIKAVLLLQKNRLGDKEKLFLEALTEYWATISNLIQRQEHGSLKEQETLVWEDGRRVIFQTIIVMYEVDRALSRKQAST